MKPLIITLMIISATCTTFSANKYWPSKYSPLDLEELEVKAAAGDMGATLELASRYKFGVGVEKDLQEGAKWFKILYEYDPNIADSAIHTSEQLENLKNQAETGDLGAAYELAWRYEEGLGALIEQDMAEARKWYLKLANTKHENNDEIVQIRRGMLWVGRSYRVGYAGFDQDYSEAFKWFTKCYKLPLIEGRRGSEKIEEAIEVIGLYRHGDTTFPRDEEQMEEWIGIAEHIAAKDITPQRYAPYELACAYENGEHIPQNMERAVELIEQVASKSILNIAKVKLAAFHYKGRGTPVDKARARELVEILKKDDAHPWCSFAEDFPLPERRAAQAWFDEATTVAEELNKLYEEAYFLETAKGQAEKAIELYRQVISTQATYGTHPVIVKALERLLAFYSDPENDPGAVSYRTARNYLALCKKHRFSPAVFGTMGASHAMDTVPELKALSELCEMYYRKREEIILQDEAYREAVEAFEQGQMDELEMYSERKSAFNNRLTEADRKKWADATRLLEKYVHIRNTAVFEYLINDYEKRGEPFPTEWIIREQNGRSNHLINCEQCIEEGTD